jgi:molybdate-binding protein/DNA-binding XRE family transcriptional regulator
MAQAKNSPHPLAARRSARGWTQAELAASAGVPRTTISAIEGRQLTPSVTAAIALSHALECSVEDLFAPEDGKGAVAPVAWAWLPGRDPARYWEAAVGARLLRYPVEGPLSAVPLHDGVWINGLARGVDRKRAESTLVVATCDPAAGVLAAEYARASGFRMLVLQRGGQAALALLKEGLVHVAGLHRSTPAAPQRNADSVREGLGTGYRLLRMADWQEGLALSPQNRGRSVSTTAGHCRHWALREPGSAARECLDELLHGRRAAGRIVAGHMEVAEAVRSGWAEAGVCVRLAAEQAGLHFLPIRVESLDLCYETRHEHDPRIEALVRLLRSRSQRQWIGELPGYDARCAGAITNV